MDKNRDTDLNNMIKVPTRLATLVLAKVIDKHKMMLAHVRLNSTRVRMNFQKIVTEGTRPTKP